MASKTSKAKSIRLSNEMWAEVEYAAALHGVGVNDEIKARIQAGAVEMPVERPDGQTSIFDGEV